jgi:hypothetical protein
VSARKSIVTLSAFGMISLPITLFSQAAPPPPQMQPGPEVAAWLAELQQIQSRLDPIEQQALQDPALQIQQQALSAEIIAAMVRSDSSVAAKLDRLQAIIAELHEAGSDPVRMESLAAEVLLLKPHIDNAQARAMQDPQIDAHLELFRAGLYERMEQIDPEARSLIVRYQALERLLQNALDEAHKSAPSQQMVPGPTRQTQVRG